MNSHKLCWKKPFDTIWISFILTSKIKIAQSTKSKFYKLDMHLEISIKKQVQHEHLYV